MTTSDTVVWRGLTFVKDDKAKYPRFICGRWVLSKPKNIWQATWDSEGISENAYTFIGDPHNALDNLHKQLKEKHRLEAIHLRERERQLQMMRTSYALLSDDLDTVGKRSV